MVERQCFEMNFSGLVIWYYMDSCQDLNIQISSLSIIEVVKIIVLLWFCLSTSRDIVSYSVPPGCDILLTSLFVGDTPAYIEIPKGLAIF